MISAKPHTPVASHDNNMLNQLPNSEQRLNALFQAFDDILLVLDKQGRILDYRAGDGSPLDIQPSQESSLSFDDFFPNEVHQKYDNALKELLNGQKMAFFEYNFPNPKADAWFESRLVSSANEQTIMFVRNITKHKHRSKIELTHAYDMTIESWSRALYLRDQETEDHTRRVTVTTLRLARRLGISESELTHIKRGSILHDIGKVAIPDHILFKPGPLTEDEWEIMRRHPLIAVDILKPISFMPMVLTIPRSHHEKWDGSGYPDGLSGVDIPLYARIFAFADVYDALTSARPYRPAWTKRETFKYILEQAGRHFDPSIVPVFIRMVSE